VPPSNHAASAAAVAARSLVSRQQLPLGSGVDTSVLPAGPMLGVQRGFPGAPFTQQGSSRSTMGAVSGASPGAAGKRLRNCGV
jgi:hypothetical protein